MTRPDRPAPNFTWAEVTARWINGVSVPGRDLPRLTDRPAAALVRVCTLAEVIRADLGEPLWVTSGYRHGDTRQHGQGQALDLQARTLTPLQLIARIHALHAAGKLPGLRQVIAEARGTGLAGTMAQGSARWVHIAVLGEPGEPFAGPSESPWLQTADGSNYVPWRA